uniref:SET domain-containing protein n=1 Tax=Trichobilharzia regenti TaxID=157069 RepID=A0AA85KEE1_TRIRE|nr:unnamed protein product [Trichobilharzia regenti]
MDIRRRTTYLSRGIDGRPSHNYRSFFQSAQRKYYNVDPDSGIRIVGPMFELTACVELKGDEDDFETMYPDTSLSYGPTICSFGLKYNDHNYALPSGLTPPSMAPHLMDLQVPKNKFSDSPSSNLFSKSLFAQKPSSKFSSADIQKHGTDKQSDKQGAPTSKRFTTDESDGKKHTEGPWELQSEDSEDKTSSNTDSKDHYMTSRYSSQVPNYEQMELRCEPELKVIEVPEELAVSPSQLSDLDSDTSDGEYVNKIIVPTSDGSYVQQSDDNTWAANNAWRDVRCICGHSQIKSGLIRCPKCSACQHVQCMESYYNVTMPRLSDGYTCNLCNIDNMEGRTSPKSLSDKNLAVNKDGAAVNDPAVNSSSAEGNGGTKYVELAADRAKRLGLLSNTTLECDCPTHPSSWPGHRGKELDASGRPGWAPVNWEKLTELSRSGRRHPGDTDVNLRMPSPPRASKRKQDLSSTSYNDAEVTAVDSTSERSSNAPVMMPGSTDELSSVDGTPVSTPTNTPVKAGPSHPNTPVTPSTPVSTHTPATPGHSNPQNTDSSPRRPKSSTHNKARRVLFSADGSPSSKRRFDSRTNPLGAAWAKDYQEAESNVYTKAILERVNTRISANAERNHKIPPACLTRSSLCRVVLFDHNEKGLEASIRLAPNEVVTEVRGHFLLIEEYEHYVDPVSEYNRYVMFYRGFGDRVIVIDSSLYGNSARFVRRSCIPNCRLEHYVVQNKLQIVIRTSVEIMPGTELTIPFDLDYRACRYPLDCACARSRCPVLKWRRKLLRNKVVPNLDYNKYIQSQLRVLSKTLSPQESSTHRRYDSGSSLSASPLIKSSTSANSHSMFTIKPSSSSVNFRKEIELPKYDYDFHQTQKSKDQDQIQTDTDKANVVVDQENSSSDNVNQPETCKEINTDLDASEDKNTTITDENQIPETSNSIDNSTDINNSKISPTKLKDSSNRKSQGVNEEKQGNHGNEISVNNLNLAISRHHLENH